jgi:hypothetical protein
LAAARTPAISTRLRATEFSKPSVSRRARSNSCGCRQPIETVQVVSALGHLLAPSALAAQLAGLLGFFLVVGVVPEAEILGVNGRMVTALAACLMKAQVRWSNFL